MNRQAYMGMNLKLGSIFLVFRLSILPQVSFCDLHARLCGFYFTPKLPQTHQRRDCGCPPLEILRQRPQRMS